MDHWAGGIFLTRIRQGKEDVRKEKAAASRTAKKRSVSLFRMVGIPVEIRGSITSEPDEWGGWTWINSYVQIDTVIFFDNPSVIEFAIAIVGTK